MKNLLGDWFRSVELNSAHAGPERQRSEEHTSELQSQSNLVCRLLLEKKKKETNTMPTTHDTPLPPKTGTRDHVTTSTSNIPFDTVSTRVRLRARRCDAVSRRSLSTAL